MNKKDIKEYHDNVEKLTKSLNKLPKLKQDMLNLFFKLTLNESMGI